ncbi:MAG: hypothetical protein AAB562_04925 [Patescibacteria group bacterium]
MKLRLLPTVLQGVRMLPILYAILGMADHKAHGIEALRGVFPLLVAIPNENEVQEGNLDTSRGEAHLLHPHESHPPEAPEPEEKSRRRMQPAPQETDEIVGKEGRRDTQLPEPMPGALRIFRNYIPPVPERSHMREYFV